MRKKGLLPGSPWRLSRCPYLILFCLEAGVDFIYDLDESEIKMNNFFFFFLLYPCIAHHSINFSFNLFFYLSIRVSAFDGKTSYMDKDRSTYKNHAGPCFPT